MLGGVNPSAEVYRNIEPLLEGSELIEWGEAPRGSTIRDYAQELIRRYRIDANCDILGVSFGGVVAQEISNIVGARHCFVISSVASCKELSFTVRLFGRLPCALCELFLLVVGVLARLPGMKKVAFARGARRFTGKHGRWFRWATSRVISWKLAKQDAVTKFIRIHGNRDRTFPVSSIEVDYYVAGGGHLIIATHANELAKFIDKHRND